MADKFMYKHTMMIHKINPSVDKNLWLKRLNTQIKVVKPTNYKTLL